MGGLGFQVDEYQMRYNVDEAATTLQGEADTNSYPVPATECYQAELESPQVQAKGQPKQAHCFRM